MLEIILITLVVLLLGLFFIGAFRLTLDWKPRWKTESSPAWLEEESSSQEELPFLPSLFQDEDYFWLRDELGLTREAAILKHRRIKLARRYLQELRHSFDQLQVMYASKENAPALFAEKRAVSEMALGFRTRIAMASLMLPLNYVRFNLSPLGEIAKQFSTVAGRLREQPMD